MMIFKIFRGPEFAALVSAGETDGAPVDVSDGFIHFSTADQVAETAAKHFAGEDGLWLLRLDSETLEPLKWEVSRGGARFPHLYRPLRCADVTAAHPLHLRDGAHDFGGLL